MTTPQNSVPAGLPAAFTAACKLTAPLEIRAVNRTTGVIHSCAIGQPFAFVGRAKGVGVHLDDPSVSQCHAYLQVVDGVPHCFDLGSRTGVLWDDGGRGQGPVYPGQTLRLGAFDVQIDGGAEPVGPESEDQVALGAAHAPPLAVLEIHSTGPNGHFSLDRPVTLIGRHPNCHLRFMDPEIAYFHCALVVTSDGVWLLALPTRQGIVLNGRAVRLARLRDGDLLELPKVSLVLRDGDPTGQSLIQTAQSGSPLFAPATLQKQNPTDVVAAAMGPIREMMEQFQQCFVTMARMFTVMQQEHTAMMCEQMRQVQELMRESREAPRVAAPGPAPAPTQPPSAPAVTPAPTSPKMPTPKVTQGPEAEALADAHNWFLDRMAKLGQPQPPAPKRG